MAPLPLVLVLVLCTVTLYAQAPTHCGRSRYHGEEKRIVGGQVSRDGEWPWLVSMMVSFNGAPREHICGGTLIRPQWVLCAAHCFQSALNDSLSTNGADYTIRFGEYDLYDDDAEHIDITPTLIIQNDYDFPNTLHNDVALVKLPSPVDTSERVNMACVPGPDDALPPSCTVAGWGFQVDGGSVSPVVRHVEVDLVDITVCSELYVDDTPFFPSWEGILCAGDLTNGGRDACQYDSGGPLVCYNSTTEAWVLAGVVSTGGVCGSKDSPGIYTKVQYFLPWIEATIAANS